MFWLSKAALVATTPSILLVGVTVLALLQAMRGGRPRPAARRLALAGALGLGLAAFTNLGCLALQPLEQRFPPARPPAAGAIIVLGGAVSARMTPFGLKADLGEAGDRLTETARLARRYPQARVIVSGGAAFPRPGRPPEADLMAQALSDYGVERTRLVLERRSRTTAENARFLVGALERAPEGPRLLVTSAAHMPRAMGALRAAGLQNLAAAPTDWRCDCADGPISLDAPGNLGRLDVAAREYLGLVAYAALGRSETLFPAPNAPVP